MTTTRIVRIVTLAVLCAMAAGCHTYEQKREQARLRFEKATAKAKLPLAREFFESDRIEEAHKTARECLDADPDDPQANLLMGQIELSLGRLDAADACFLKAVEIDPKLHQGWSHLGAVAQDRKQAASAFEYHLKALDIQPLNAEYILLVAQGHAAAGRYDQAVALLEEKARYLPGEVRLKVAAADIRHRLGDLPGAMAAYRQALGIDADNMEVMESLGYCYITKELWSEAAEMFETLADRSTEPRKSTYAQILALCTMNAGQYGKAVAYYDKLSVGRREDPALWLQMGRAALGSDAPDRALACAQRALTLRPAWEEAITLKGCAQYLNGDYAESVKTFRSIVGNKELGGFAWLMMGRSYQQLGDANQAQKAYETAAKLNPDSKLVALLRAGEKAQVEPAR